MTVTLGIDLAAQPPRTAVAAIAWGEHAPELLELGLGSDRFGTELHDKWIYTSMLGLRSLTDVTKVGIDAPLGWPQAFVSAVAGHSTSPTAWPVRPCDEPKMAQRPLLYRATDDFVRNQGLANPLSVSSDRIAYCAMRCARILAEVADRCGPEAVERDGGHLVCEVYPAPALRHWTQSSAAALAPRESYKGPAVEKVARRWDLLKTIVAQIELRDPHGLLEKAYSSPADDYIDALVSALVARACELKLTLQPPAESQEAALAEGWIHLPTSPLSELR